MNDQVNSKALTEMVTSSSTKIQLLNTNEELREGIEGVVGKPLPISPKVKVLDSNGQPLAGIMLEHYLIRKSSYRFFLARTNTKS